MGSYEHKTGNILMGLTEYGMNQWFLDNVTKFCKPSHNVARITVVHRGQYVIRSENGDLPAKATRKFMKATKSSIDMPCVGDWVCFDYNDSGESANIHAILPRKTFLRRQSGVNGTKLQMIAANIDMAFVIQSCHHDFDVPRLERYLLMASEGGVEPLIILTKTDLVDGDVLLYLIEAIRDVGIKNKIIGLSNITGDGHEELFEIMTPGKTYCLVGSSGIGKSTLVNKIIGKDTQRTGAISNSGEGRHTTVRRELILLENGAMLIDTPGMRGVGVVATTEEVEDDYNDIMDLASNCRFANCNHTNEPGCAVIESINDGELLEDRYLSYMLYRSEVEQKISLGSNKRRKK